jgi:hypothetical protein
LVEKNKNKKTGGALKMPKVLVEKKYNFRKKIAKKKKLSINAFSSGKAKISLVSLATLVLIGIALSGFFYLYQVNDLATKGFEIKKVENKIENLREKRKKLKIQETELKSMYNLEKEVKDMNLVNCSSISYIEHEGPLAMK